MSSNVSSTVEVGTDNCYLCGGQGAVLYGGVKDYRAAQREWTIFRCSRPRCQLLWLYPSPTDLEISESYSNYYTHAAGPPLAWPNRLQRDLVTAHGVARYGYGAGQSSARARLLKRLIRLYPGGPSELGRSLMYLHAPKAPSLLVDIGCGNGEFLERMKGLGWNVVGLDTDAAAVAHARQRGLTVYLGDLASCQLPDAFADAVTMSHVIEHVRDPLGVLRESLRVLKPGGLLSLVTPNAGSLGARAFGKSWFALDVPRHLVLFRPRTLRSVVAAAGFTIESLSSSVTGARSVWTQSLRIRQQGRLKPGARPSVITFIGGIPFQILERVLVGARWDLGEELMVRARKPKTSNVSNAV